MRCTVILTFLFFATGIDSSPLTERAVSASDCLDRCTEALSDTNEKCAVVESECASKCPKPSEAEPCYKECGVAVMACQREHPEDVQACLNQYVSCQIDCTKKNQFCLELCLNSQSECYHRSLIEYQKCGARCG
jgi:hypothetical protein